MQTFSENMTKWVNEALAEESLTMKGAKIDTFYLNNVYNPVVSVIHFEEENDHEIVLHTMGIEYFNEVYDVLEKKGAIYDS